MGHAQATMSAELLFRSARRTHAGAVRKTNQDALLALDSLKLWGVFDGMGGHAGGETASALIVDKLRTLADATISGCLEQSVERVLHDANAELCARNAAAVPPSEMGTTAAVLGMEGERFFCLWAGDSRVYRLRSGSLTQLTHDHRLVQEMVDAGVLSEIDALGHPQRNVITRALGIENPLRFDKCRGEVEADDVFVLVTDGVSGICTADDIVAVVCDTAIERAADKLSEICLHRGAPDNFTLILTEAKRVYDNHCASNNPYANE